jgi:hypothetical protein
LGRAARLYTQQGSYVQDTDYERAMDRHSADLDAQMDAARQAVERAMRDILASDQQHGVITVAVKVVNGVPRVTVEAQTTKRY